LLGAIVVVVPVWVILGTAHKYEYVFLGGIGEDGRKGLGCVACFGVKVHVRMEHLVAEICSVLFSQFFASLGFCRLDGELFLVEVPELVADSELDPDELVCVVAQEPAQSTGEVRVEHGVAVARRREDNLVRIADARLEQADLPPELVAVHVVVFARETDILDFARRNMEVVSDVVDKEEKRHGFEIILVDCLCQSAGKGSAPFVADNRHALEADGACVGEGGRCEEGEPEVVVTVGKIVGRAVHIGPAEKFVVIDVCVEWVVLGTVDFERVPVEPFLSLENTFVAVGILDFGLVERRNTSEL
jgi:hypothetical protein